jgi:hypothetical protein
MSGLVAKAPSVQKTDRESSKKTRPLLGGKKSMSEKETIANSIDDTINGWMVEDSQMPEDEPSSSERLPIGDIRLDPDNHRTRHINEFNPTEITLLEDHPDYQETVDLIEGLKVFAEHLKKEPLQQEIKVYKHKNRHWIGPGARRWLSCKIAFGDKALMDARVYETKPRNLATARFVENNQREDTSLYVRILDFRKAEEEQKETGITLAKEIAVHLGLSAPIYSRLSRVSKDSIVMDNFISPRRVMNLTLASRLVGCLSVEEAEELFGKLSWRGESSRPTSKKKKVGRARAFIRIKPIKDLRIAKKLINGDVFKEVHWTDEDFQSLDAFQEKLDLCLEKFSENINR